MKFIIGDYVEMIDEKLTGKVISQQGEILKILTEDNFTFEVLTSEVVKVSEDLLKIDFRDIEEAKKKKETPQKINKTITRGSLLEVDLHIDSIESNRGTTSNYQMLSIQMNFAKNKLEYALDKRIKKIIFIHGFGQGILKSELLKYLSTLNYVSYYDADYKKYGRGATEVNIHLSKV